MAGENYRRVVPSFWTDPDLKRKLTLEQKALLLYFFTSPHSNMIGLYYSPLGYVSAETGLSTDDIRRALAGVLAPFVNYDDESEEVFVRRSAFHQMGELRGADKRKEGVRRLLEGVHSPRLKRAFLEQYAGWELGVDVPDSREKALDKGLGKGLLNGSEGPTQAIAVAVAVTKQYPAKPVSLTEYEIEVLEHYRKAHPKRLRGEIPKKVIGLLRTALKSYTVTDLCRAIDGNASSDYHRENGHLGLDLILRDSTKIDYYLDLAGKATAPIEMTDTVGEMRRWKREPDGSVVTVDQPLCRMRMGADGWEEVT